MSADQDWGHCGTCRYFCDIGRTNEVGVAFGQCRSKPPRVFQYADEDRVVTRWPVVNELNWCGAHRSLTPKVS